MLYVDFEIISKSVGHKNRGNINQMKIEQIKTVPLSGRFIQSTFGYGNALDQLNIYSRKESEENFLKHT